MVTRKNGGCGRDLLIALFDQPSEDLCSRTQASLDLSARVLAIGLPDYEVSGTLQQSQESDEKEEKPASESAKLEPQG